MNIDIKTMTLEVLRLADERPDFVYPKDQWNAPGSRMCEYRRPDGEGGACLFGQAIWNIGREAYLPPRGSGAGIEGVLARANGEDLHDMRMTDPHLFITLAHTQQAQDKGEPWGDAVQDLRVLAGEKGWI